VSISDDIPVIDGVDGSASYVVGGGAVVVDDDATVNDADTDYFNLGTLKVALTTNKQSTDRLEILSVGDGTDGIRVVVNEVYYEGTLIGTFTGTTTLTFSLNQDASRAAVQKLLRSITFRSTSASPSLATRTVTVSLLDGEGGTSQIKSKSILMS
jgi:hypothetical protein